MYERIQFLEKHKTFSMLVAHMYHRTRMEEKGRQKTAIKNSYGPYQLFVMPFGPKYIVIRSQWLLYIITSSMMQKTTHFYLFQTLKILRTAEDHTVVVEQASS